MTDLEKEVESIIFDLIDSEDLKINDNDEIEYTQKWLNEWLMGWILDGYTTKEVIKIREYFENFYYEDEREVCDTVYYEDCNGGIDWYEEKDFNFEPFESLVLDYIEGAKAWEDWEKKNPDYTDEQEEEFDAEYEKIRDEMAAILYKNNLI